MDPRFGLIHVKVQTWFPMVIQVYVNGHEWLARKLSANGIGYTKIDNVFTHIDDIDRAQTFADRLPSVDWPKVLEACAGGVNPLLDDLLKGPTHYWVVEQSEFATDTVVQAGCTQRTLPPFRQPLHAMLWRQGSHGLPWAQAPRELRG